MAITKSKILDYPLANNLTARWITKKTGSFLGAILWRLDE